MSSLYFIVVLCRPKSLIRGRFKLKGTSTLSRSDPSPRVRGQGRGGNYPQHYSQGPWVKEVNEHFSYHDLTGFRDEFLNRRQKRQ